MAAPPPVGAPGTSMEESGLFAAPRGGGKRAPKFQLLEKLPRRVGYLRSVRAFQTALGRTVEIRVLAEGTPPELEALYHAEKNALVRLDHPAFLPVLMDGKLAGRPCYAVPLRRGRALAEFVADAEVGLRERCRALRAAAGALAEVHLRGGALGAVRPEVTFWDDQKDQLFYGHHVVHDPRWAGPWVAAGAGEAPGVTAWSRDVYFWGATALWVLTGGDSARADGPPADLAAAVPGLSPGFAHLVAGCLAPDPVYRPENGLEVLQVLREIATDVAETAGPPAESAKLSSLRDTLRDLRDSGKIPPLDAPPAAAPPAAGLDVHRLLRGLRPRGIEVTRNQLAATAAVLLALMAAVVGQLSRPPAPPVIAAAPPEADAGAGPPERREGWEIRPLPPSAQAAFRADPRVARLLGIDRVDAAAYRRAWPLVRKLVLRGKMPKPLDAWGRLADIQRTTEADPPAGHAALGRYLRDLRVVLGSEPPAPAAGG